VKTKLRLRIEGFIFFDYVDELEVAKREVQEWMDQGKLQIFKTVHTCKFDEVPCGLEMILKGGNIGSLVTEIVD